MKKVRPTAILLVLVLVSISVVTAQVGNSSQGPRAAAKSATNESTARKNTESTNATSGKTPGASSLAQKYYESGAGLYASGKLEEAIGAFKQATKLQPDDPQTHYMLGMAHSQSKVYKEAFESFKRAARFRPDWPQAHFRLGVISYLLGRRTESVEAYNNLLRLGSPLSNTLYGIIKENNSATFDKGVKAGDWSLTQTELVRAAAPAKEATRTPVGKPVGNSDQVPTANAESRSASASPVAAKSNQVPTANAESRSASASPVAVKSNQVPTANTESRSASASPVAAKSNQVPTANAESRSASASPVAAKSNQAPNTNGESRSASASPAAAKSNQAPNTNGDSRSASASPAAAESNQAPITNGDSRSASASTAAAISDSPPKASNPPAATEDSAALTSIYKIGVGDVLDIRVLNSTTTRSTLYTVIDGGFIDLALAGGPITVAGLTTDEIQALIAAELKRRAIEEGARVSVGVRQYASHSVTITGLVNNPGTKFLRREAIPLYVLMAEAQTRLDAGRVAIMRPGSAGLTTDLSDPAALNLLIRPGDMISITARPQEFYYIAGRITYPGQKTFQPGVTLLQAILAAGGVMRQGDKIEISREGQNGRLATTTFSLKEIKAGKIQDPRLQPGDRIEVVR